MRRYTYTVIRIKSLAHIIYALKLIYNNEYMVAWSCFKCGDAVVIAGLPRIQLRPGVVAIITRARSSNRGLATL
jgi:hypothetical protein